MPDNGSRIPKPAQSAPVSASKDTSPLAKGSFWDQSPDVLGGTSAPRTADPIFGHFLSRYSVFPDSGGVPEDPPGGPSAGFGIPIQRKTVPTQDAEPAPTGTPTPESQEFQPVTIEQMRQIMQSEARLGRPPTEPVAPKEPVNGTPQQRKRYEKLREQYAAREREYQNRKAKYDQKMENFNHSLAQNVGPLNASMKEFGIRTPHEQAAFLANIAVESSGMTALTELPSAYASSKSKYKGRGFLQLTGAGNYADAGKALHIADPDARTTGPDGKPPAYDGLLKHPELAADPAYNARISAWYWSQQGKAHQEFGDKPAEDLSDFRRATARVNIGPGDSISRSLGYGHRLSSYSHALSTLHAPVSPEWRQKIDSAVVKEQAMDPKHDAVQKARNQANSALKSAQAQHDEAEKKLHKQGKEFTPQETAAWEQKRHGLEAKKEAAQIAWDKVMLPDQKEFTQSEKTRVATEQDRTDLSPEQKAVLKRQSHEVSRKEAFITGEDARLHQAAQPAPLPES